MDKKEFDSKQAQIDRYVQKIKILENEMRVQETLHLAEKIKFLRARENFHLKAREDEMNAVNRALNETVKELKEKINEGEKKRKEGPGCLRYDCFLRKKVDCGYC